MDDTGVVPPVGAEATEVVPPGLACVPRTDDTEVVPPGVRERRADGIDSTYASPKPNRSRAGAR